MSTQRTMYTIWSLNTGTWRWLASFGSLEKACGFANSKRPHEGLNHLKVQRKGEVLYEVKLQPVSGDHMVEAGYEFMGNLADKTLAAHYFGSDEP